MFIQKYLRPITLITLFLFIFLVGAADLSFGQKEDDLSKARQLYQNGDYEGSISLLSGFIEKLKAMVEQKRNVAEAFYLLAKIYFEVGDDAKVKENLGKVFETYPAFTMEESNYGFKERVDEARKAFQEKQQTQPKAESESFEETKTEAEPKSDKTVIEQPAVKKKKKFPTLLVVGGVVVVGVLAALLLKKKKDDGPKYDIRGNWTITMTGEGNDTVTLPLTFSGTEKSGSVGIIGLGQSGSYTVTGDRMNMEFGVLGDRITAQGRFGSADRMSGDGKLHADGIEYAFSWHATRGVNANTSAMSTQSTSQSLEQTIGQLIETLMK